MRRSISSLAAALLFITVISHPSVVAAKDNWVSLRTEHFFVLGNAGEKEIKQVALKLEQFRAAFTILFPTIRFNTPVPTRVLIFKNSSSYDPFKIGQGTAGYFQAGPDVNHIVLTTEVRGEQNPFTVIFHEYTHLLVNNNFDNAPLWFNEGLATYNSTFSVSDDQKILLGSPIANYVFKLRDTSLLPLRTLFQVDHKSPQYNERDKRSIFYAQSWALVHYLVIGKEGRKEQLGKFLQQLNSKVPVEKAFQEAFGMTFEDMEKELRKYVSQSRYNVLKSQFTQKLAVDTSVAVSPLSEAETQAHLGDLLLHIRNPNAYVYLQNALKLDPNLAMAHASLGMVYFREGKIKEAHASLERAVAANSQNYLAHYYYAYTLSRSGPDDGPYAGRYEPEVAEKIRQHARKSLELRPDFPEAYNLLGFVSLVTGKNLDEAISSLKRALNVSPGRYDFTFMLGQLYFRQGNYKAARETLEQILKSHADERARTNT